MTLALCMIAKDEDKELIMLLGPLVEVFDEICVLINNNTNPKTIESLSAFPTVKTLVVTPTSHPHLFLNTEIGGDFYEDPNFAALREESFKMTNADFIMWLDADDTLVNSDKLRETVSFAFSNPKVHSVFMPYEYDHDEYGNVSMTLWRERVIRRNTHQWKGELHESLIPIVDGINFRTEKVVVSHNVDVNRVVRSGNRNLRISKWMYERDRKPNGCVDPRTTLHYAKSLNACNFLSDAVPVFEEFLDQSDWDDEKYQVLLILADMHTKGRQYAKSQNYIAKAFTLRPMYGQAYFELAKIAYHRERWEEVVHLVNVGFKSDCPKDIIPTDPTEYTLRPLVILEYALFMTGQIDQALLVCNKALELAPKSEHLLKRLESIISCKQRFELEKSALTLGSYLQEKEDEKLPSFVDSLPKIVSDHPRFVRLRNELRTTRSGERRLVIFCGWTYEAWSPVTAKEKGIGGSEEAVIYLSRELTKLGWLVDVFCNCSEPGEYDGVRYYNAWEHDKNVPCEIFVAWRNSEYVEEAPEKARVFLWLHDVQKAEYYTQERINKIERIFVLSKWHRTNLESVPEEKFFYTRNGITSSDFTSLDKIKRNPLKCVYASSPDRGLDVLLEEWTAIKKACPDAHLHVFYGFTETYDKLHANNEKMLAYKEHIMKMLKQDGVFYHGKVTHATLHEHFMSAGLWLYPTNFTEISCITAMKAQAAGAIPVCTTVAALDETVQYGYKISFNMNDTRSRLAFRNITIKLLNSPTKQEETRKDMMGWARDFYDWKNVAIQWDVLFKGLK
jgi:glycosyltransferase involved in cell wall biosynthesis